MHALHIITSDLKTSQPQSTNNSLAKEKKIAQLHQKDFKNYAL